MPCPDTLTAAWSIGERLGPRTSGHSHEERITELGKWGPGEGEDGEGSRVSWKMQCHAMLLSEASTATAGFSLSAGKAESLGCQSPACF